MLVYLKTLEVRMRKNLSDAFPVQSGLKQGDALLQMLFNFNRIVFMDFIHRLVSQD
jgi:hypothetical protein